MPTLLEIIKRSTDFLEKRGVASARLDAELLMGHALGLKRMQLYLQFERALSESELEKIRPLVVRRGNREPLQHIVGETEFLDLKLKVDKRALIPRPETEYLIELITPRLAVAPQRILDLGTGSGAIALALARIYPQAAITAVDQSESALTLARENAAACGLSGRVSFLLADWFSGLTAQDQFQLIVANPPYLTDEETQATEPEVKNFEPAMALSAGKNGAAALNKIIRDARTHLASGGLLACETGITQHAELQELAATLGYARLESLQDLTGRDRYLLAFR
ncbi:MAG: peptide chain release factor N(5)-glutamine methyltransferase [Opitutae bacterium]|nr:peptide chain release factor N(5)-glutamine methyltransferase [Opitutae bacterium]